jgi:hypothetical protein
MPATWLDADLLVFTLTVGRILTTAGPRLRRNLKVIPREYDFEELSVDTLTEQQVAFFGKFDAGLLAMHYRPVCTYRIRNYVANLVRVYINPADRAACTVLLVETIVKVNGLPTSTNSSVVGFLTNYPDGKALKTRNMRRRTLLEQPPELIVQECPNEQNLRVLKQRHDARANSLGIPLAPDASAARIFDYYQREHRRFSELQVERGTYERVNSGYVVSSKAHWRGIRNFLVPFAERFSVSRLSLAALLAVGIPSVLYLRLLPEILGGGTLAGLDPRWVSAMILMLGYAIAGAVVGSLLEMNDFIWAFLLTFVGVHLVTGWWSSTIPFGLVAGISSHAVAGFRKRRRVVLRTSEA